jgi:hypothetical protein
MAGTRFIAGLSGSNRQASTTIAGVLTDGLVRAQTLCSFRASKTHRMIVGQPLRPAVKAHEESRVFRTRRTTGLSDVLGW